MLSRKPFLARASVICLSMALIAPLPAVAATPAEAPDNQSAGFVASASATPLTSVTLTQVVSISEEVETTDSSTDTEIVRESLTATTPAELEAIRAEEAAAAELAAAEAAAAEAERQQAEAQAQAQVAQVATANTGGTTAAPQSAVAVNSSAPLPNSSFLAAVYAQLGSIQDCTVLVERALRAIGYNVGDLGPMGFGPYGTQVAPSQIQAGDIMMRNGHVAVYTGDGVNHSAIHSGWNGNQTVQTPYESNPNAYAVIIRVG